MNTDILNLHWRCKVYLFRSVGCFGKREETMESSAFRSLVRGVLEPLGISIAKPDHPDAVRIALPPPKTGVGSPIAPSGGLWTIPTERRDEVLGAVRAALQAEGSEEQPFYQSPADH